MEESIIEKFCKDNHLSLLILFGSQAEKSSRAGSDFDLALKPERGCAVDKLRLIFQLGELLSVDTVDLVILTPDTDPVLLWEICMKGKVLYESAAGLFEKERLRAWKIYQDTEKLRSLQKEYVKKVIRKAKNVARGLT